MPHTGQILEALQQELQAAQDAIRTAQDPGIQALRHRDAAYAAMDLGDFPLAMTHAVTGLDLARSTGDLSLQAKAHVTIALVMSEVYDDQGAAKHLDEAGTLSRVMGDVRGVALVAVNAAHYAMERRHYAEATRRLHALITSAGAAGLEISDPQVGLQLQYSFHINYVKSASLALEAQEDFGEERAAIDAQLRVSVQALEALQAMRDRPESHRLELEVLDALATHAAYRQDWPKAQAFADNYVTLSQKGGIASACARALHSRAELSARREDWSATIRDATQAAHLFTDAGQDLRAVAAWQVVADSLAQQNRYEAAFQVQRNLTRRAATMYRAFFQQGAQLRVIEQQAQAAEVRAVAFAEAALRDPLTGMPNRAAAMQALEQLHQEARQGRRSAAAVLDIDHFKSVNDRYGHAAGDEVLQRTAQAIRETIRETDCLARIGGEEFLLLFPDLPAEDAERVCERITDHIIELEWPDIAPDLHVTVSIGVTDILGLQVPSDTLRSADQAMYAAKQAGRHMVQRAKP